MRSKILPWPLMPDEERRGQLSLWSWVDHLSISNSIDFLNPDLLHRLIIITHSHNQQPFSTGIHSMCQSPGCIHLYISSASATATLSGRRETSAKRPPHVFKCLWLHHYSWVGISPGSILNIHIVGYWKGAGVVPLELNTTWDVCQQLYGSAFKWVQFQPFQKLCNFKQRKRSNPVLIHINQARIEHAIIYDDSTLCN